MPQHPAAPFQTPPAVRDGVAHGAPLSAAERTHDGWLREHRPDLAPGFAAALPGARAAILARLWGAIVREPLPGRTEAPGRTDAPGRARPGDLRAGFRHTSVHGPAAAAVPFAPAEPGLTVGGHRHPAALATALWPAHAAFAAELDNSVANLALARAGHRRSADQYPHHDLADAEQSVVDGHPLHPGCRTRTGMTVADVLAYAPEHHPTVDLPVIAVPPGRWISTGDGLPPRLPMHPWQWDRIRAGHPYLTDTGERRAGRPLMSLRTLATAHGHVKTAVDVGMTSATRTVSAAAIHNGPAMSALLDSIGGDITVLRERAAGAVLVDGEPSRHLAVIVRDAPRLAPGERAMPVAALTAGAGIGSPGRDPVGFLARFSRLLLPPLFRLLDLGVALEAHGQNLILVTRDGRPHRLLYRDFGGVRVSPARLARHGITAPPLRGDVPTDDPAVLRTKVLASAVATVLAGLVADLAGRYHVEPATLWAAVPTNELLRERADLPLKAMTAMRLAGTADTAGTVEDLWTTVPNPLAGRP